MLTTLRLKSAARLGMVGVILALLSAGAPMVLAQEQAADPGEVMPGPKYFNLRFDEDFSYLGADEGSYQSDFWDPIKHIRLDDDWSLSIGGEFRLRVESRSNAAFGARARTSNTQQLYRWMLHFDLKYRNSFRVFAQGIVAHAEDQDTGFNSLNENHGDLQQLFVDFRPYGEDSTFVVRIGRQELQYGNERLISPFDWASTRRRFDAVKLMYTMGDWSIDGFYAKPVVIKREQGDDFNEGFDFGGLYATYSGIENHGLDVYALAVDRTQDTRNANGSVGDQSVFTLGSRFWGMCGAFDYEAELAGQWGKWAGDTVQAWSWTVDGGYTFDQDACKPRIGAGFDWASGDKNPFDRKVGTFNQLFPDGHRYFGLLDLVGRQNVNALNVNLSAWAVPKKVKTVLAYHTFWLNADKDSLYNAGGAPTLRDASGRAGEQVGQELDVSVSWKLDAHSNLLFVYSHFWNNSFVHGVVGDDDDPDLFYVQYQYKF
ncbi:MAG: alginate export family protein [Planctomycetes bacterium]|nr:alginate export family protein [Planctomycetota bacterium]